VGSRSLPKGLSSKGTAKLGLEALHGFLRRHRRIGLDTSIFFYELEATPRYAAITGPIFSWIEEARHSAVTSTITMAELLVQPYRNSNQIK
jgi:hypothetical protein